MRQAALQLPPRPHPEPRRRHRLCSVEVIGEEPPLRGAGLVCLNRVPRDAEADLAKGVKRQAEEELLHVHLLALRRSPLQHRDQPARVRLKYVHHALAEVVAVEYSCRNLALVLPDLSVRGEDALSEEVLHDVHHLLALAVVVEVGLEEVLHVRRVCCEREYLRRPPLGADDDPHRAAHLGIGLGEPVEDNGLDSEHFHKVTD
mmetsp:Transcript_16590/g.42837  ORF Transcript_16590/g.42837 Transcript_16590/m.42837 type:complete len:203 (+) Transcript_16590:742-1350(+)